MNTLEYENNIFVLMPDAARSYVHENRVIKVLRAEETIERERVLHQFIPEFLPYHPIRTCVGNPQWILMRFVPHLKPLDCLLPTALKSPMLLQVMAALIAPLSEFGVAYMEGWTLGTEFAYATDTLQLVMFKPLKLFRDTKVGPMESQLVMVTQMLEYIDRLVLLAADAEMYELMMATKQQMRGKRLAEQIQILKELALGLKGDSVWLQKIEKTLDALALQHRHA